MTDQPTREAIALIDELTAKRSSLLFYGINETLSAKLLTIRATLERALSTPIGGPAVAEALVDRDVTARMRAVTLFQSFVHGVATRHSWTEDQIIDAVETFGRCFAEAMAHDAASQPAIDQAVADERDWTGGRAWPEQIEAIAQYWAEWEENRAGRGTYTAEELAEDGGEFAAGLADYLAALRAQASQGKEA